MLLEEGTLFCRLNIQNEPSVGGCATADIESHGVSVVYHHLTVDQQMAKIGEYANHDTGYKLRVDQVGKFS